MRQITFFTLFFVLFLIPCLAQDNPTCPKIKVSASKNRYHPGEGVPFSVSITGAENKAKLEYVWETSAGVIYEGQGTQSIIISSTGLADIVVKVSVEIRELPKNCVNTFSETAVIEELKPEGNPVTYYYEASSTKEERSTIEDLILVFSQSTESSVLVMMEFTSLTTKQKNYRILRILNYLKRRKAKLADRFYFLPMKSDKDYNKIFFVPKKEIQDCKDCSFIKGSDFKVNRWNKGK